MARGDELRGVRRGPRPHDDHHRRPDRLPAAHREARGAGGARPGSPPRTASSPPSASTRSSTASSTSPWCAADVEDDPGDGRGRAGPGALGVPHRRRVRLAALRLRPAAGRRARRGGRGGPRGRALHARARGPRHRPAAQAAGLPAAGGGRRHRRRQPRARPARRRPRLRHRRPDPRGPRGALDAAAHQQPGQAGGLEGYGLDRRGRVPLPVRASPENLRYLRTKRDRMGHDLPDLGDDCRRRAAPGGGQAGRESAQREW